MRMQNRNKNPSRNAYPLLAMKAFSWSLVFQFRDEDEEERKTKSFLSEISLKVWNSALRMKNERSLKVFLGFGNSASMGQEGESLK